MQPFCSCVMNVSKECFPFPSDSLTSLNSYKSVAYKEILKLYYVLGFHSLNNLPTPPPPKWNSIKRIYWSQYLFEAYSTYSYYPLCLNQWLSTYIFVFCRKITYRPLGLNLSHCQKQKVGVEIENRWILFTLSQVACVVFFMAEIFMAEIIILHNEQ